MAEATIRDVARRAQVSIASVSRALNGLGNVRQETRERVIAAAAELGYVPHAGARSLSLARAHAVGVVLPDLHGEFFSEFVRGMDREASRHGYVLLLSNIHDESEQAANALRAMRGRVDGLIVMAPHLGAEMLRTALPPTLPSLFINGPEEIDDRPTLRLDNVGAMDAMVAHLVANGHRRIVHVAGPEGNVDARERVVGYRAAMARHAPDVEPVILAGDFSEEGGEAAIRTIRENAIPCDAVFAANDMMAIGCLQALKAAGIDVPGGIAVAGFDDVPLARYLGVTTVRVRIAEMGARAIERLIDLLEGGPADVRAERHGAELVVRDTTAARARPQASSREEPC
ncbi:LacI family DNA-binding transcriptional regulator [Sphingomonas sp. MS122]|uniref:LacI family DNA-binding transcriptional regulator n=1 Tax=Sphingomonas sp. MS122 TaxID=3412683 RepID=UPI003C3015CA